MKFMSILKCHSSSWEVFIHPSSLSDSDLESAKMLHRFRIL